MSILKFIKNKYSDRQKRIKYQKEVKGIKNFVERMNRERRKVGIGEDMMVCKKNPLKGHSTTSKHCDCWR